MFLEKEAALFYSTRKTLILKGQDLGMNIFTYLVKTGITAIVRFHTLSKNMIFPSSGPTLQKRK